MNNVTQLNSQKPIEEPNYFQGLRLLYLIATCSLIFLILTWFLFWSNTYHLKFTSWPRQKQFSSVVIAGQIRRNGSDIVRPAGNGIPIWKSSSALLAQGQRRSLHGRFWLARCQRPLQSDWIRWETVRLKELILMIRSLTGPLEEDLCKVLLFCLQASLV